MSLHNPLPMPTSGKISEPGVYSLPIEIYHGQPTVGPSISSSGLRTIWAQSPAHYYVDSPLNPKRAPQPDRPAFALGRQAMPPAGWMTNSGGSAASPVASWISGARP